MAKAPMMPVWTDALIADTTHLSAEQFGCYVLILLATWRNNGKALPDDDSRMARISRVSANRWRKTIRPALVEFFGISDGYWHFDFDVPHNGRLAWKAWDTLREEVFSRDGKCVYCGSTDGPFECDHIIPLSRGGTNDISNLATACAQCNRAKQARTPEEWGVEPTLAKG